MKASTVSSIVIGILVGLMADAVGLAAFSANWWLFCLSLIGILALIRMEADHDLR